MSTKKIFEISVRQVKAARELLGWKQTDLAGASGLSIVTIRRTEAREGDLTGRDETIAAIRAALEAAGVEFTNGDAPGVKLRKRVTISAASQ